MHNPLHQWAVRWRKIPQEPRACVGKMERYGHRSGSLHLKRNACLQFFRIFAQ